MNRRRFLTVASSVGVTALAGCTGENSDAPAEGDQTPSPTPTAEPTATPYPEPQKQTFEGYGQTATDTFVPLLPGPTAFGLHHSGDGNFVVGLLNDSGERVELLANEIGSFTAMRLVGVPTQRYSLDIEADGGWNIQQITFPIYKAGSDSTGEHSDDIGRFVGPLEFAGGERVTFSASGNDNNIVWLRDRFGRQAELLFNEVGRVNGASTRITSSGVGFLEVQSNGKWNIEIE